MIDLVRGVEQILDEEQVIMDDHEDKVAEITERLQQLPQELKAAPSVAHPTSHLHHLCKRLNQVERIVHSVKNEIEGLTPRPDLDSCLLRHVEEQVGSPSKEFLDLAKRYFVLRGRRARFVRYRGYTS